MLLFHPLPYLFDRVQLRRIRWEFQEGDILAIQCLTMPARPIHDDHGMTVFRHLFRDRLHVALHGGFVDAGQYQTHGLLSCRAHGAIQIGILKLLLPQCARARAFFRPLSGQAALLTDTGFILKPQIDLFGPDTFG